METNGHFRFSTEIIKRLGEELNPSPEKGVLELVKNSYDADATQCTIEIQDLGRKGSRISVIDNGDGMTLDQIQDRLLVVGSSTKSKRVATRLGRIPAGSKGLGRLAALRMGDTVRIRTCERGNRNVHELRIDWRKFDRAAIVEDVDLPIVSDGKEKRSGTSIFIEGATLRVKRMDVKRLARELILLADPFPGGKTGFRPRLIAPEFQDLADLVENSYFRQADFHLVATLDEKGQASASVLDWRGRPLYSGKHADISGKRKGAKYESPACSFEFWTFILSDEAFRTRKITIAEVREWLRAFGGVHLYENSLRVDPYGNPGHDWLELNLRRSQSPEERPSTNNSIGRVSVADREGLLIQKTDRSGFIESEAFQELRQFAKDALDWLARRRLDDAERRRQTSRSEGGESRGKGRVRVEKAIAALPRARQEDVTRAFEAYEREKQKAIDVLRKEVQLYRTLSTAGITAATFAHESAGNPLKIIEANCDTIRTRGLRILDTAYEKEIGSPLERIRQAARSVGVLGSSTLRLIEHEKRRTGNVDINATIETLIDTFDPFVRGRKVQIHKELDSRRPQLYGTDAALESILTNLLNNSMTALLRHNGSQRQIWVTTRIIDEHVQLVVEDNGPGVQGISMTDIWLPGETTQPNGTGLGLTIVRDAVADLGGAVHVDAQADKGGARFSIDLPMLRKGK